MEKNFDSIFFQNIICNEQIYVFSDTFYYSKIYVEI
jgi:membrane-anchored protein YejM (alkaline phosphatase superfamily)